MLQKLSYIREERLDIIDTCKEQHEALLEVVRGSLGHSSLVSYTASLPWSTSTHSRYSNTKVQFLCPLIRVLVLLKENWKISVCRGFPR